MTAADEYDFDYDESDDCWECSGEGGWNSCMEDCCPAANGYGMTGEEACEDPRCWKKCPNCKGTGRFS